MYEYAEMKKLEEENEIRFQHGDYPVGYGDFDLEPELPCMNCKKCGKTDPLCSDCVLSYEAGGTYWEHYKDKSKPFVLGINRVPKW